VELLLQATIVGAGELVVDVASEVVARAWWSSLALVVIGVPFDGGAWSSEMVLTATAVFFGRIGACGCPSAMVETAMKVTVALIWLSEV